jgi:hypothetical protein
LLPPEPGPPAPAPAPAPVTRVILWASLKRPLVKGKTPEKNKLGWILQINLISKETNAFYLGFSFTCDLFYRGNSVSVGPNHRIPCGYGLIREEAHVASLFFYKDILWFYFG